MFNNLKNITLLCSLVTVGAFPAAAQDKVLHIYNCSDYIAEDTIDKFTAATGIKVVYDIYDSNEVLEAKMLAGRTGYDIVVPTARFPRAAAGGRPLPLARQEQAPEPSKHGPRHHGQCGDPWCGQCTLGRLHVGHDRHRLQRENGAGEAR